MSLTYTVDWTSTETAFMLGWPDYLLLFSIMIYLPVWSWWSGRILRARLEAGDNRARIKDYVTTIIQLWLITGAVLVIWLGAGRPVSLLGLTLPFTWTALGILAGVLLLSTALLWMA